jgi:hypothetical protein
MEQVQNKVKGLLKGYNAALQNDGCARMAMVTQISQSATQTKSEQMFAHNSDSLEAMRKMHVMIAIDVKSMFTATDIKAAMGILMKNKDEGPDRSTVVIVGMEIWCR